MKTILMITLLVLMALLGVGHSAHQSGLHPSLSLSLAGSGPSGPAFLREGGGYILREDGSYMLREN